MLKATYDNLLPQLEVLFQKKGKANNLTPKARAACLKDLSKTPFLPHAVSLSF